jgi:hypothetical protein
VVKPTKITIVAAVAVAVASVAWFSMSKTQRPVSVAFMGCTNPILHGDDPDLGFEPGPNALFQVTNHTAMEVRCDLTVEGFKPGTAHPETTSVSSHYINNHSVVIEDVFTPGGTNAWRFHIVLSAWGTRPRWQQNVRAALDKVGIPPGFLSGERIYRPVTNEWTIP